MTAWRSVVTAPSGLPQSDLLDSPSEDPKTTSNTLFSTGIAHGSQDDLIAPWQARARLDSKATTGTVALLRNGVIA
jgi:hypothetical protein